MGTTVSLKNIFSTVPVRQKEFHRNLKREFAKMTQLLIAYCLVSTNVKQVFLNKLYVLKNILAKHVGLLT